MFLGVFFQLLFTSKFHFHSPETCLRHLSKETMFMYYMSKYKFLRFEAINASCRWFWSSTFIAIFQRLLHTQFVCNLINCIVKSIIKLCNITENNKFKRKSPSGLGSNHGPESIFAHYWFFAALRQYLIIRIYQVGEQIK